MSFGDYNTAAAMRDAIVKIATETVNRLRPEERTGTVYSYEQNGEFAYIQLPGHTSDELIKVRYSKNMAPSASIDNGSDTPDIVRVAGKAGSYFISQYVRGVPLHSRYELTGNPTGAILPWGGDVNTATIPNGYLRCLGDFVAQTDYPDLFVVLGHNFNRILKVPTDPRDGTFRLPDGRYRNLIGSNPTDVNADFSIGNTDGQDGTLTDRYARADHRHAHSISGQDIGVEITAGGGSAQGNIAKYGQLQNHAHSGSTGNATALGNANAWYHAWLTVNYIIKT